MNLPQFLAGMVTTIGGVATWVFTATGSVWLATGWAVAAALVLQVGYFVLLIGLIYGKQRVDHALPKAHQDTISQRSG